MKALSAITEIVLPDGRSWAVPNARDAGLVWREIFEAEVYGEAAAALRPRDVVIDVGAHTGLSALYLAGRATEVRVVAFEPAPATYACLARNLALHVPGATSHRYALGNRECNIEYTYYPLTPSQSGCCASREADDRLTLDYLLRNSGLGREDAESLIAGLHVGEVITVPMRTVSHVMASEALHRVALLKIDVERSELDVLTGINDADWPRVDAVVAEVHDLEGRLNIVRQMLAERGFRVAARQEEMFVDSELWTVHATR